MTQRKRKEEFFSGGGGEEGRGGGRAIIQLACLLTCLLEKPGWLMFQVNSDIEGGGEKTKVSYLFLS